MSGFIAVHVGAGYHGEKRRPFYQQTCKKACRAAMQVLKNGSDATEAVVEAVSVLEDCPITNAGVGSNLTLSGTVECDASVMEGSSLKFGSVGALSNVKNPVKVALKILQEQKSGLLSCGRIPPCTLVGNGAQDWAASKGIVLTDSKKLITPHTEGTFLRNLALVQNANAIEPLRERLLDTVGAICVDSQGNVASAVSSGGILLKHPGRLGQAAIYGSGCWAQNSEVSNRPSVACSVTGVGEYITQTMLAYKCCDYLYKNYDCLTALPDVFKTEFWESPFLNNINSKSAGILALKNYHSEKQCELLWVHNTKTMILGYMTSTKRPTVVLSIQPGSGVNGKSIIGSERCLKL